MNRNFRLTQSAEFERVRRSGRSYAHPLIVLVVLPAEGEATRFGVRAGRSVGTAVERNKAKRLVREAIRPLLTIIPPGWKVILISRRPILDAKLPEITQCVQQLFMKAGLLYDSNGQ